MIGAGEEHLRDGLSAGYPAKRGRPAPTVDVPISGMETAAMPARPTVRLGGRIRVKLASALSLAAVLAMLGAACVDEDGSAGPVAAGQSEAIPRVQLSDSDRDVLVALYYSAGGASWSADANWLSAKPVGEWYGVNTNSDGRVTELALPDNQLTGEIPPELSRLSNLSVLALPDNQLTGEIPPELGLLSNLTGLLLGDNQLTGKIPPELGRLSNLMLLFLDNNRQKDAIPPELGRLSNLTELFLHDNQLTGDIPPELGALSNLTWLALQGNQLTGCIPESWRFIAQNDLVELNLPECDAALSLTGGRIHSSLSAAGTSSLGNENGMEPV